MLTEHPVPAHKRQYHHLSVSSAARANKCAKTHLVQSSSSQQRHRQLQFLRYVHTSHKRINANSEKQPERYSILHKHLCLESDLQTSIIGVHPKTMLTRCQNHAIVVFR